MSQKKFQHDKCCDRETAKKLLAEKDVEINGLKALNELNVNRNREAMTLNPKEEAREIIESLIHYDAWRDNLHPNDFPTTKRLIEIALEKRDQEIAALKDSIVRHFTERHLEGDGPKIDRLEREIGDLKRELAENKKANLKAECYIDDLHLQRNALEAKLGVAREALKWIVEKSSEHDVFPASIMRIKAKEALHQLEGGENNDFPLKTS